MVYLIKSAKVAEMERNKDIKGIVQALTDKDPEVKRSAVHALMNMKKTLRNTFAVDALITALHDPDITKLAITALGDIGDKRASDSVFAFLSVKEFQGAAANALVRMGDTRANETIIACLSDPDSKVRFGVIYTACLLKDNRVEKLLINIMTKDPEENIREAAFQAIKIRQEMKKRGEDLY